MMIGMARILITLFLLLCVAQVGWTMEYVGVVHPQRDVSLSLGVGGVIAEIGVQEGKFVKSGRSLFVLYDGVQVIEAKRRKVIWENRAEMESLEQRLSRTNEMVSDMKSLFEETGAVSRDELYRLELDNITLHGRYDKLKKDKDRELLEFQAAEEEIKLRHLTAPINGYITNLPFEVGEWVKPGEVVMRIVDALVCRLHLVLPLTVAATLAEGDVLPITFESAGDVSAIDGRVTFISVIADPASGLVEVKMTFNNPKYKIRPGVKGFVHINTLDSGTGM